MPPEPHKETETMIDTSFESTTPTTHHAFSPSSLNRLRDCPGSYVMQLGLEETATPESSEGTMLHDRIARKDFSNLTPEQEEMCELCLKEIDSVLKMSTCMNTDVVHEKHLTVKDAEGNTVTSGTADVVIIEKEGTDTVKGLTVIDWKFGRTPVADVGHNLQLAAYALGAMQRYGATSCRAIIFQPRIKNRSEYTFTKAGAILSNISAVIARANSDKVVLQAGDQCKYCLAKSKCPAFSKMFQALMLPEDGTSQELDPATLLDYWNKAKIIEKAIAQLKLKVEEYVTEHGALGEWHWKEKPGNREFTSVSMLMSRLSGVLTPAEFIGACKVSVTSIVTMLVDKMQAESAAKGLKLTKTDAKKQVENQLADLIQRGKPTKTLVQD